MTPVIHFYAAPHLAHSPTPLPSPILVHIRQVTHSPSSGNSPDSGTTIRYYQLLHPVSIIPLATAKILLYPLYPNSKSYLPHCGTLNLLILFIFSIMCFISFFHPYPILIPWSITILSAFSISSSSLLTGQDPNSD